MTPDRVVLVVGPPLAGVDGVVDSLGRALPDHVVVGMAGLEGHAPPDAVVGVVSAVAPVPPSDWGLIERAAAGTDLVIAVVAKIDAHRGWREVLEANRELVAGRYARRRSMPWVGVAAAPDLGEPCLGELVGLLSAGLAGPCLQRRNAQARLQRRRPPARHRPSGEATVELRSVLQRTRLALLRVVRDRCTAMRVECREGAAAVPVGGSARFETAVHEQAEAFLADLDVEITRAVADAAAELGIAESAGPVLRHDPPDLARSPSPSRRLEGRLMAVLGIGFGLGVALAASRLLAGLTRGPSLFGLATGLAVGLALVVWVVRARGLLHDRALLDRWVTEVTATLRWQGESAVAERLLLAEVEWVRARVRRRVGRSPEGVSAGPIDDHKDVTDQYEW